MNVRLVNAIAGSLMLCGCGTSQMDRVYFCSLDGSRLESVYFDRSHKVLVLNDVVITGNFDCDSEDALCFHSSETSFEFDREGYGTSVVTDEKPWGGYEWRIDYSSGTLFFRVKREGEATVRTCEPVLT